MLTRLGTLFVRSIHGETFSEVPSQLVTFGGGTQLVEHSEGGLCSVYSRTELTHRSVKLSQL